jgi:predicted CoA-substrate-specific enzyme activase
MITAGIDSGSLATKGVVLGPEKEILSFAIELTGGISKDSGERVYKQILEKAGLNESNIDYVVSTGYGRENLTFSKKNVTEITCHGAGVHFLFPEVATILDIGGQDSKAIRIDENGQVLDFVMNDKCSAGTGRFSGGHCQGIRCRVRRAWHPISTDPK